MKRLLCSVAASAVVVWLSAGAASATTIDVVDVTGFQTVANFGSEVTANVSGTTALSYGSDFLDFELVGGGANTSVGVDDIVDLYGNEVWQLVDETTSMTLATNQSANNVPSSFLLSVGDTYRLALQSDAPAPGTAGDSSASVTITSGDLLTTPLPGTMALFAGGLGLLGFAGLRKRGKATRGTRLSPA